MQTTQVHPEFRGLLLVRAVLSLIILAGAASVFAQRYSTVPFRVQNQPKGYVVEALPEIALPVWLHEGDVLDLAPMTPEARAAVLTDNNLPPDLDLVIHVHRGGESLSGSVRTLLNNTRQFRVSSYYQLPIFVGVLLLAFLTLWRGMDWSSWGLTIFSVGICLQQILRNWPVSPLLGFWLSIASHFVGICILFPGLFISADALAGRGLSAPLRRFFRGALILMIAVALGLSLAREVGTDWYAWTGWMPFRSLLEIPQVLELMLPLPVLILGYRNSDAQQRLRIRWVLWSTVLLGSTIVAQILFRSRDAVQDIGNALAQALCFVGYLYAVLRHRLVDVSFVIDRALVYGLTTSFVVGVFALVENFAEQAAVGNDASFLLQAGATLVLAFTLSRVHRWVEAAVDRLFFRRQHRAVHELNEFARQCAFIEQHDRLLSLTVDQIDRAIDAGVAIYERGDSAYRRLIARGANAFPPQVDLDDRAFIALRASLQRVDLEDAVGSALGQDGGVFPMALRGGIIGAIVCAKPRGEQFSPDEQSALAMLAQEVGVAIYVLRAREQEKFVAAIASGEARDLQGRARELLPNLSAFAADIRLR